MGCMTRHDVLRTYDVKEGVIHSPGRFEGQALYVPYFWNAYLCGNAHEVGADLIQFTVLSSDRTQFPELGSRVVVQLRQRSDGRVVEA